MTRNVLFNLVGQVVPIGISLISTPLLVRGLGIERFGLLSLAWVLVGYFSLFDFGLGRAVTKAVAEALGNGEAGKVPALIWTSLFIMSVVGSIGAIILGLITPYLIYHLLVIPGPLQQESVHAFLLLSFSVPIVVVTAGLKGILEAHHHFALTNILRFPLALFTFVGPVLVLPFSRSLIPVVAVLLSGRAVVLLAHVWACLNRTESLSRRVTIEPRLIRPLMSFGGWMTVTNIVGPVMVTADRFLIGAILSTAAVAYYSTPSSVVAQVGIVPDALVGVLFPAFASSFVRDPGRVVLLFGRAVKVLSLMLFPLSLLGVIFSSEGLGLWLGDTFAANSTHVLQWLIVGMFFNGIARIPFALLQGAGQPRVTGLLHILELPVYVIMVWLLTHRFGIEGTAAAWCIRVVVDAGFLFALVAWHIRSTRPVVRQLVVIGVLCIPIFAVAPLPTNGLAKIIFLLFAIGTFACGMWVLGMSSDERQQCRQYLTDLILRAHNRFRRV